MFSNPQSYQSKAWHPLHKYYISEAWHLITEGSINAVANTNCKSHTLRFLPLLLHNQDLLHLPVINQCPAIFKKMWMGSFVYKATRCEQQNRNAEVIRSTFTVGKPSSGKWYDPESPRHPAVTSVPPHTAEGCSEAALHSNCATEPEDRTVVWCIHKVTKIIFM